MYKAMGRQACKSNGALGFGAGLSRDGLVRPSEMNALMGYEHTAAMGKLNGTFKSRRQELRDERLSGRTGSNDLFMFASPKEGSSTSHDQ